MGYVRAANNDGIHDIRDNQTDELVAQTNDAGHAGAAAINSSIISVQDDFLEKTSVGYVRAANNDGIHDIRDTQTDKLVEQSNDA